MTLNIALVALLVLMQIIDALTTIRIIRRGGHEGNRLLVWMAEKLPGRWTWLIVVKLIVIAAAVAIALLPGKIPTVVLIAVVAVYAWLIWHNVGEMRK